MNSVDFTGKKFGKLTALTREVKGGNPVNHHNSHTYWICQCDCGNKVCVRADNLLRNISCGCVGQEQIRRYATAKKKYNNNKERRRIRSLRQYSLTLEDYNREAAKQNQTCKICGEKEKRRIHLCVDHDHITGKFRGLLCDRCNRGLGSFRDNPNLLKSAIQYLSNNAQTSPTPIIALQARNQETESPE